MSDPTTIDAFEATLAAGAPPPALVPALRALWWARKGAWDEAHAIVQDEAGPEAAWVHAWLHRVEGDPGNAAYWYARAGRPAGTGPHETEWREIARMLTEAHR